MDEEYSAQQHQLNKKLLVFTFTMVLAIVSMAEFEVSFLYHKLNTLPIENTLPTGDVI